MAFRSALININSHLLHEKAGGLLNSSIPVLNTQFVRHRRTKHWDPKWKLLRRLKVFKVKLPDFNEGQLSEEEVRSRMKERGLLPHRPWQEFQHAITSTGDIFEPYIPPEGDGKVSPISAQGAKQGLQLLEKKGRSMLTIRKVAQFDEDFDTLTFCKEALQIYIKMHELMAAKDKDDICDYITETAYPLVMHNIENKTLRWRYIKDIELPRVVHARHTEVITPDNVFAQLTVRFHTQQTLAVYDRFGRLIHGSEIIAKDVLEYVVFEKHLSNMYGKWRIHQKIIPSWLPAREPERMTYKKIIEVDEDSSVVPHEEAPKGEEKVAKTVET